MNSTEIRADGWQHDVAGLRRQVAAQQHEIGRLRQEIAQAAAAERERIAAVLRRAAAGRREYAERGGRRTELERDVHDRLTLAAACCESAAQLITDPDHILDVIPAWRWTAEETAALLATR